MIFYRPGFSLSDYSSNVGGSHFLITVQMLGVFTF